MSVPSYERKPNEAQYVIKVRDALLITNENLNKLGKNYIKFSERMLEDCTTAYSYAKKADQIFMSKENYRYTYMDKQRSTQRAIACIGSCIVFYDLIYSLVKRGDQSFGNKETRDKVFVKWGESLYTARAMLESIYKSNKDRKNTWDKQTKEKR